MSNPTFRDLSYESLLDASLSFIWVVILLAFKFVGLSFWSRYWRSQVRETPLYAVLPDEDQQPIQSPMEYYPASFILGEEIIEDNHQTNLAWLVSLVLVVISSLAVSALQAAEAYIICYCLAEYGYAIFSLLKSFPRFYFAKYVAFGFSCVSMLLLVGWSFAGASIITWVSVNHYYEVDTAAPFESISWVTALLLLQFAGLSTFNRYQRMTMKQQPLYSELESNIEEAQEVNAIEYIPSGYFLGEQLAQDNHRMNLCFWVIMILFSASAPYSSWALITFPILFFVAQFGYTALTLFKNARMIPWVVPLRYFFTVATGLILVVFSFIAGGYISNSLTKNHF